MSDVVAALDLDNRSFRAVATTLASPFIVNATDADRCGRAFFPTLLNVRAEVGHRRIIGSGSSRIKSGMAQYTGRFGRASNGDPVGSDRRRPTDWKGEDCAWVAKSPRRP